MELINPLVQEYAEKFSSPEDYLLKEVNDFTAANHPEYHMLSGHLQGKFLEMASMMIRPHRILEIGTFTGYSALCLAKGLTEDGLLHTIELREKDAATAKGFFDKSTYKEKIILHTGDAKKSFLRWKKHLILYLLTLINPVILNILTLFFQN